VNIRIQQGQLVNHSYAIDDVVTDIRAQALALESIKLGTDTFGVMNVWMPPILNQFFLTDSDTVHDMADTVGRCADAVRSTARDFGETDDAVSGGFGGGS
jgi:hypothetical protein